LNAIGSRQRLDLIKRYEAIVGREGIRRARLNNHSQRKPIQCGLTIHPGNDCAYSCVYCYIPDMGFKFKKPTPCELSPEELALALLYNKNFLPGRDGTYIAIGSIVEPFQPELKSLTLRYIVELAKVGNPLQFSTKSYLTSADAETISSACSWASPLITILTLDDAKAHALEPLAPKPRERLCTIKNLAGAGLKPFLFLRPVLPGIVTIEEYTKLIDETIRHGANGVVMGNLRVTRRIIEGMKRKGLDISEIVKRARLIDDRQRVIPVLDIQNKIEQQFSNLTKTYRRACCASAYCANLERCIHEIRSDNKGK
jgi:DNA repair photolyase